MIPTAWGVGHPFAHRNRRAWISSRSQDVSRSRRVLSGTTHPFAIRSRPRHCPSWPRQSNAPWEFSKNEHTRHRRATGGYWNVRDAFHPPPNLPSIERFPIRHPAPHPTVRVSQVPPPPPPPPSLPLFPRPSSPNGPTRIAPRVSPPPIRRPMPPIDLSMALT